MQKSIILIEVKQFSDSHNCKLIKVILFEITLKFGDEYDHYIEVNDIFVDFDDENDDNNDYYDDVYNVDDNDDNVTEYYEYDNDNYNINYKFITY